MGLATLSIVASAELSGGTSKSSAQARASAPPRENRDEFADRNIVELREGLPGDLLDGPCRHDGAVVTDEIISERRQGVRHPADGSTLHSHRHPPRRVAGRDVP